MKRIFTGFMLAPAASVLSLLVGGLVWALVQEHGHLPAASVSDWEEIAKLVMIVLGVAYVAAVIFGLPCLVLFRRKRISSAGLYALAGGCCAFLACVPFMLLGGGCDSAPPSWWMISPMLAGAFGGLVFWRVSVWESLGLAHVRQLG